MTIFIIEIFHEKTLRDYIARTKNLSDIDVNKLDFPIDGKSTRWINDYPSQAQAYEHAEKLYEWWKRLGFCPTKKTIKSDSPFQMRLQGF